MLKLPKGQKKKNFKKNQKIQSFKSIEIKQYIYIYIKRESMIIAFLLLKLARQLNVLQKMNLKIHM